MKNKYRTLFLISNALIILDQYTKFMVAMHLHPYQTIEVIENFFHLTHVRNPGVAFGLFAQHSSEYKALIFVLISSVAIAAILVIYHQTPKEKKTVHFGLILIFSGAIGNLIDRIVHKEVIDFLDFFYNNFHFPAFNIADSCITIGVGIMIFDLFRSQPQETTSSGSSEKPVDGKTY